MTVAITKIDTLVVGASQALPIVRVATRQQSGFVEDLFRSQVADRTNWRALLKGNAEPVDLSAVRDQLFESCAEGMQALQERFGLQAVQPLHSVEPIDVANAAVNDNTFPAIFCRPIRNHVAQQGMAQDKANAQVPRILRIVPKETVVCSGSFSCWM